MQEGSSDTRREFRADRVINPDCSIAVSLLQYSHDSRPKSRVTQADSLLANRSLELYPGTRSQARFFHSGDSLTSFNGPVCPNALLHIPFRAA